VIGTIFAREELISKFLPSHLKQIMSHHGDIWQSCFWDDSVMVVNTKRRQCSNFSRDLVFASISEKLRQ
jgi:hypothetical protein